MGPKVSLSEKLAETISNINNYKFSSEPEKKIFETGIQSLLEDLEDLKKTTKDITIFTDAIKKEIGDKIQTMFNKPIDWLTGIKEHCIKQHWGEFFSKEDRKFKEFLYSILIANNNESNQKILIYFTSLIYDLNEFRNDLIIFLWNPVSTNFI